MAGSHLSLQQEFTATGSIAQLRDPLRRLHIQHAGVVQRGHRQDVRVVLVSDVLVRRVGGHVIVVVGIVEGIAPLVPLDHRQWQLWFQHGGQRIDEWHDRRDTREAIRRHVRDSAHQHATGRTAFSDHRLRCGEPTGHQIVGHVDEVKEGVFLLVHLAIVVPTAAHLSPATHVRDGEDHAAIQQREPRDRKSWVHAGLIGAIAIQQGRRRRGGIQVGVVDHRYWNLRAIPRGGPQTIGGVVAGLVTAEHFLTLQQRKHAGSGAIIVQVAWLNERGVAQADHRRIPFWVSGNTDGVELFGEFDFFKTAPLAAGVGDCVQHHDRRARDGAFAVGKHQEVAVSIDVFDAGFIVMGNQKRQVA